MKLDDCIIENFDTSSQISEIQMQISQIDTQIAQRVGPLNMRKLQLQRRLATLMKQSKAQEPRVTSNPTVPGVVPNGGHL